VWYRQLSGDPVKYRKVVNNYISDPAKRFADSTRKTYCYNLLRIDVDQIEDVTEQHLLDVITSPTLSGSSQIQLMKTYRSFFSWAEWLGLIETDPSKNLNRVLNPSRSAVRENVWLDKDDVMTFLGMLHRGTPIARRNRMIFQLGFTTGLRRTELTKLTWGKLDLDRGQASIVGKGGKLATVYLTDTTVDELYKWKAEGPASASAFVLPSGHSVFKDGDRTTTLYWDRPLDPRTLSHIVQDVSTSIGMRIATHDMRRSFAGMMVEKAGIETTSVLLRHSNLGTTQVYLEKRQDAAYQAGKVVALDL
jgi:integrase